MLVGVLPLYFTLSIVSGLYRAFWSVVFAYKCYLVSIFQARVPSSIPTPSLPHIQHLNLLPLPVFFFVVVFLLLRFLLL